MPFYDVNQQGYSPATFHGTYRDPKTGYILDENGNPIIPESVRKASIGAPAIQAEQKAGKTLAPATAEGYDPAYGGIPQVPSYIDTTKQAVEATTKNWDIIKALTEQINALNLAEQTKQYQQGIPGYDALVAQSSANTQANLAGQLPTSVKQQIQTAAAQRGVQQGMIGSQFNTNDYLRSLGLNSLAQQQVGEQNLTTATARMPRVTPFNPAQYTITPAQAQEAQYQANLLKAAPIPSAAAAANMDAARSGLGTGTGMYRSPAPTAPTSASRIPNDILSRYAGAAGIDPYALGQETRGGPIYGPPGTGMAYGGPGTAIATGGNVYPVSNYNPMPAQPTGVSGLPNLFDFLGDQGGAGYQDYSAFDYGQQQDYYPDPYAQDYSGFNYAPQEDYYGQTDPTDLNNMTFDPYAYLYDEGG